MSLSEQLCTDRDVLVQPKGTWEGTWEFCLVRFSKKCVGEEGCGGQVVVPHRESLLNSNTKWASEILCILALENRFPKIWFSVTLCQLILFKQT